MDGVFLQAFIYLAATVIVVPIATRLKLGSVLGYLVAGVVVGPFALNLVGDATTVGHVAEFGVVILLFLIGMEVQPSQLWQLRTLIVGVGAGQLAGTGLILSAAGWFAGLAPGPALVVGFTLAMSSTAIVLQLLDEKGLRRNAIGRAGFAVLLFQDLAVIPLLALLPLAGGTGGASASSHAGLLAGQPGWIQALASLAAVAAVVGGGRYLARPIFRIVASARLREVFTASALLLVVGVALLMQLVGLSPALGAFLAGVVLAESEYRRELETDIEPFRGLLLGVFFVTVGAGLDLALVARQPLSLGGYVIGVMAAKSAILATLARLFGLSWVQAGFLGIALSQVGEFAFVLLSVAIAAGVLEQDFASLTTAAVALSMAATPLAVMVYERLAANRKVKRREPENDFGDQHPEVLVAGYGRFGQVVSRVLIANGYGVSVLENSVEQIELVRRFGRKAHYGDASRLDLLRAAGAESARVLVVAIDDRDKAGEIVETARDAFPHLTILARAFDRRHAYDLLERGAERVERELFEGGLAMSSEVLVSLGWRAYRAERAARLFRRHDERLFHELRPLWQNEESFITAVRESSPRMEDLLRADLMRLTPESATGGWDTESLYGEMGSEPSATVTPPKGPPAAP